MKQAESPACTKNRVAEAFQSLLACPFSGCAIGTELPISIAHLLSEAIWAGISQEALFIVQAGILLVLQQLLRELHALSLSLPLMRS